MGQKIEIKYKGKVLETVDVTAKTLVLQYVEIESIRDVKGLDQLVSLESLSVFDCGITRIEGLDHLVKLEQLSLEKNKITKIEGLDQLVNLESLNLQDNHIAKIEGLDRLMKLKFFDLGHNKITRIEGLDTLVNLESLNLQDNQIARIEGLDRLANLKHLDIGYNKITRIEGLGQLVNLDQLFLDENQIAKIKRSSLIEKMNFEAKDALKAKDFTTSANILNELVALCTQNLQAARFVKGKYSEWYFIENDADYRNWKVNVQANIKILEKAKIVSQGSAGLSERQLRGFMRKWMDHAVITTADEKKEDRAAITTADEKKGKIARKYSRPTSTDIFFLFNVVPALIAIGIFIGLGFLFIWLVPPSYITIFWCALIIAGSVGGFISLLHIMVRAESEGVNLKESFIGVIRVNGFVYAGEFIWFLIVSLQLAGAAGIMILIQFIGQFGAALVFQTMFRSIE